MSFVATFFLVFILMGSSAYSTKPHQSYLKRTTQHSIRNIVQDSKEGGETIEDAFVIEELPYIDSGETCDNQDDYEVPCPYGGGIAPDVVYKWDSDIDGEISIDLCGSLYDTKVFVLDSQFNVVECNDDYYGFDHPCGEFVSYIGACPVSMGETYYFVIDGYVSECGTYSLRISDIENCSIECSGGAQFENEPPLQDGYVDTFNGGCDGDGFQIQQIFNEEFCGVLGWFEDGRATQRDTDWFELIASGNEIHLELIAETRTICKLLEMDGCQNYSISQWMVTHSCQPMGMSISTQPGDVVILFFSSYFTETPGNVPSNEYEYQLELSGVDTVVSTDTMSWDGVKALFR